MNCRLTPSLNYFSTIYLEFSYSFQSFCSWQFLDRKRVSPPTLCIDLTFKALTKVGCCWCQCTYSRSWLSVVGELNYHDVTMSYLSNTRIPPLQRRYWCDLQTQLPRCNHCGLCQTKILPFNICIDDFQRASLKVVWNRH